MENQTVLQTLRQKTLLSLAECQAALKSSNNDLDLAITLLQKQGLKKVEDIIEPRHGQVHAYANGFIIELNCEKAETAKMPEFNDLLSSLEEPIGKHGGYVDQLLAAQNALNDKLTIRKIKQIQAGNGKYFSIYNHNGGSVAVILQYSVIDNNNETQELANNISMHIAAAKPLAISSELLDQKLVDQKKNLFASEITGKMEAMRDKIIAGKMARYYGEVCLLNQEAIWQPKTKIVDLINKYGGFMVNQYIRLERGLD